MATCMHVFFKKIVDLVSTTQIVLGWPTSANQRIFFICNFYLKKKKRRRKRKSWYLLTKNVLTTNQIMPSTRQNHAFDHTTIHLIDHPKKSGVDNPKFTFSTTPKNRGSTTQNSPFRPPQKICFRPPKKSPFRPSKKCVFDHPTIDFYPQKKKGGKTPFRPT